MYIYIIIYIYRYTVFRCEQYNSKSCASDVHSHHSHQFRRVEIYKRPRNRVVEVAPPILCQYLFFEDGQSGNLTAAGLDCNRPIRIRPSTPPTLAKAKKASPAWPHKSLHVSLPRNEIPITETSIHSVWFRRISCQVTGSVLLIMAPKAKHSAMLSCTGGVGSQWRLMATTWTFPEPRNRRRGFEVSIILDTQRTF